MSNTTSLARWLNDPDEVGDIGQARIPVVTESEYAEHLRRLGRRVKHHRGRFWRESRPGFYRPVHDLARLTVRQATRPTVACWGFRACLTESDAHLANARSPVYLVSDLGEFDEDVLPSSRRYELRKARRLSRLVHLTGPAVLREQGYQVLRSAHSRNQYGSLPTMKRYLEELEHFSSRANGIVLAGLVDGTLGGYVTGFAVDATAYVQAVVISTEALSTQLSTGLTYEFMHSCRRSPGIEELVHGWHTPEDEGLCWYKNRLRLPLRRVPTRIGLLPGTAAVLRWRHPHQYYRMTGTPV
jgi:hypothetical protein